MRINLLPLVTIPFLLLTTLEVVAQKTTGKPIKILLQEEWLRQELFFPGNEQALQVCQLEKGVFYTVWASSKADCQPKLRLPDGSKSGRTFEFVATGECMDLIMQKGSKTTDCKDETVWLSLARTKDKNDKTGLLEMLNLLTVNGGVGAQSLVQDVFIGGGCFDVTGAAAVGNSAGIGSFSSGSSSVILDEGVILSTGNISNAPGPNNSNGAGNVLGGGGDPDLSLLTGGNLFDVVGLEFDFQPTIATINFQYVFASEEYCEYVNSQFNDVFGFFISGPGISGGFSSNGQNIAVLPGSGLYVAINTVNHISNTGYFVPNQGNCNGMTNMSDIQFDGWTTLLTATANVIPCETYHIRLVVGDVGDGIFDSAVFLGANTFSAGGTATGDGYAVSTGTNIVYEPCNDGSFVFTRAGGDINMPLILNYTILPSSTATPGVDYAPLSGVVVIPPGSEEFTLPVTVYNDNIPEGVETIIISLTNACSCSSFEIELEIHDPPPLEAELPDVEECAGVPVLLEPAVDGGIPGGNYTYQWSTGNVDPAIVVTPLTTTTYEVTVTDQCGQTTVATNTVDVGETPTANLVGSAFLCANDPSVLAELVISFTGSPPWELTYSINGVSQPPVVTADNPYSIFTNIAGTYELVSVISVIGNCEGPATGVAPVIVNAVDVLATTTLSNCQGAGTMTAEPSGGIEPYSYTWSNGFPSFPTAIGLNEGTYTVTVTDLYGCTGTASGTVTQAPSMTATATVPTQADCLNPNGGSINLNITNGVAPLSFLWTGGIGNVQNPTGLAAGTYEVIISDNTGCTATASATVTANIVPPIAIASTMETLTCTNTTADLLGQGSSTGANFSYQWNGPAIIGSGTTINAQAGQPGTYTLLVTNTTNGCTAEVPVDLPANLDYPAAVANGNELNCSVTETLIDGNGSSPGMNYAWTGPGVVSGGNTLTPAVNLPGTYTLTVTNPANGCTATASASVTPNTNVPAATIANPAQLTCSTTSITLDASGSSTGANYTYQWLNGTTPIPGATGLTLDADNPGTYEIVVTDMTNGCTNTYSVQVGENTTPPVANATVNGQITCTASNASVNAAVQGSPANFSFEWSTINGSISGNPANASTTVNAPGTYNVLVTSLANGCTATASVNVTQDASIPNVVVTSSGNLNCLTTQVQLNGNGSSQGSTLTYTWSTQGGNIFSGQNTLTPTVNAAGTYTLTIFDSSNSCENESSVTVTLDNTAPDVAIPAAPVLDCNVTSSLLEATVSNLPASDLSFDWSTIDGLINGPDNILNPTVSNPGTYTLLVTNNINGCTNQASITVSQNITPPVAVITEPDTLTCSNNSISLVGTGSSTGAAFSYAWTTANGMIVSGANTLNPVVDEPGVYTLLITNSANGCTKTAQTTVLEDVNIPMANAGAPATLNCTNQQLNLNGAGSTGAQFTYQWTGPGIVNGGNSLSPSVNAPGTYQLLVTNLTNACTQVSSVTIPQDIATPTAEAGTGGELSCTTTQMALSGNGSSAGTGFQYLWTSPDGNILNGETTLSPVINAPGIYNLLVTNATNGCTASDEVVITEDDSLPDVDAGTAAPITCLADEITLDGSGSVSGPDFSYQWNTTNGNIVSGSNTLNPVVDAPGIYVLTVTNMATNCTNLGSVTVQAQTAPPAAEAGQGDELTCTETSITLNGTGSASGPNFTYQWTTADGSILDGDNSLNPMVDEPGTYQLLVTNTITGCTNTDQVQITQSLDAPIALAATPGLLTCDVETLNLSGTGSSTGTGFSYAWSTTDGHIVSGANSLAPVVDEPGTYQLLVTNSLNGCTETAAVDVEQDIATPTAEAGTSTLLSCQVQTLNLDGAGSSTGSNFDYQWTTLNGNIVYGGNTLSPTVNQTGTYSLLVTNTANGCTATDNVVVNQDNSLPQAIITPPGQLTCNLGELTINASASQGVLFQYEWSTTNGNIVSGNTSLNPVINAPGVYLLTVTNLSNGCTKQTQTTVNQDIQQPSADAGSAFVMDCFEELNYLDGSASTGTGPVSYLWETANGSLVSGLNTAQPAINDPGTYLLTVTNLLNGCTDTDQVVITREGPAVEPFVIQPPCHGDKGSINLSGIGSGTPPYLCSIDAGENFMTQVHFTQLQPGYYPIVVQDAKGCEFETEVIINEPNQLNVELEPQVTLKLGDSYQINTLVSLPLSEIDQVSWFPSINLSCDDCLDPIATPTTTMLYKVRVVTINGCKDEAPILLRVDKRGGIYVPNAFSPDGDGTNDIFMIFSDPESVSIIKSFLVFNRWGETVYEYHDFVPNNPAYGWDGKHRGEPMNPAVFTWFAIVEYIDGREELYKGDVTLMK